MDRIKKVLLALDYDPDGQKLAEIGSSMAKAMNDQFVFLHVVTGPVSYSATKYYLEIANIVSGDSDLLQHDHVDQLKKKSQYFLIFGNNK